FWDTEIYILPVFTHTLPALAKPLLDYRYNTLGEARKRARVLGHPKGALYPWRTINGREASTYVPLGTAQYHINADVAYAFWQYVRVSGDTEYLKEKAAEVLFETARVWADVGCFSGARDGKYCICCVTGPDEYTAFVDNNFYTNLMARENIKAALETAKWLKENAAAAYRDLAEKIGLEPQEIAHWEKIAENMYLPYDEKAAVYLQDDGMPLRKEWDDSKIPPEKKHLLYENYHPLYLWRQRMAKQADSILGMYLHSHLFNGDEIKRNYDFYQKLTLHHSSLSTCIFGILACGVGYRDEAYRYFSESARMDLDDHHHNFYAGIHAANMAGTWQAIVNGFAGLRTSGGELSLTPYLPGQWKSYEFIITYRSSRLKIRVTENRCEVTLLNDTPVSFLLRGENYKLENEGDMAVEAV
ncbi:MAG: glycoside hydrolase family 65 protein, partial [Clostridiales bacterium]|nr:glycoside hydrolase family 65 protein [Clostridiales bacterium]